LNWTGEALRSIIDVVSEPRWNILQRIGDTSLLALRNIVPRNGSRILVKLESENPTGSMKDRMALAVVESAEAAGVSRRTVRWSNTPAVARVCHWLWSAG